MRLDFDTKTSIAFLVGMVGIVGQQVAVYFGVDPNQVLTGAYLSLIAGSLGVAIKRNGNGKGTGS